MRPDPRGIFHGINYEDTYSETGTSAFTVAMGPIRQRLQEVLSRTTDIPMPPTDWREGVCIGQGAHGRVLLCIDKETHEQLVVKKIFAKGEVSSMRRRMFNLAEEISMLSKLSHENIVKYRGVIISDNCVNIFMEYMTAGSLYDEVCVCIGQGAHGRVLLCIDKETHEQLVVKKIFAKGEVSSMRRRMFNLAEEISMLSKLSHENIVKYRGVIISDNCVNIFMEYMTAGSLYDEINKKGFGALSPKGTVETTRQILRGLEYLHDLEIVHRDIKSANILRHAYPVVFKIGDFGSAQYYRALASLNSIDYSSTPHYTAPELVKSNHPYDDKADIWSMGIVSFLLLSQHL
uniref:Protein kinase domain-containing protein n=1 Tax=Panagrolaimus sp. ES5 TaxID=591445 RepID=A0AC34G8K1_9BILA